MGRDLRPKNEDPMGLEYFFFSLVCFNKVLFFCLKLWQQSVFVWSLIWRFWHLAKHLIRYTPALSSFFWGIRSQACHFKGHLRSRSDCFTHPALPPVFFSFSLVWFNKVLFFAPSFGSSQSCVVTNFIVFVVFAADILAYV